MKRKIVGTMLAVTMSLALLVGCGNNAGDGADSAVNGDSVVEEAQNTGDSATAEDGTQDDTSANETAEDDKQNAEADVEAVENSNVKPLAFDVLPVYDMVWDDDTYDCIFDMTVDGFAIYDYEHYDLSKALQKNAENRWNLALEARGYAEDLRKSDASFEGGASYEDRITIGRADTQLVSFMSEVYANLGGAHPSMSFKGYTFDSESGQEIKASDVIKDYDGVAKAVISGLENSFIADYLEDGWQDTIASEVENLDSSDVLFWNINEQGLNIVYDSGIYAVGNDTFTIPYSENKSLFNRKYFTTGSDGKIHRLNEVGMYGLEYSFDADRDGSDDILRVDYENIEESFETEDGEIETYYGGCTITVSLGTDETSVASQFAQFDAEDCMDDCYVMEAENGKYYLYVQCSEMNDYKTIQVFDISNPKEGPKEVGYTVGAFYGFIPTNSKHFYMEDRIYFMGTYSGMQECYIGDDGMPVPYDSAYTIVRLNYDAATDSSQEPPFMVQFNENDEWQMKLLQDLTVRCYNSLEERDMDSYSTIPAGTPIAAYRTDGENYMTFILPDGRLIDIEYDEESPDDWMRTINGQPEDEVIANMIYAG